MDRLHLVGAEDLDWAERVDDRPPREQGSPVAVRRPRRRTPSAVIVDPSPRHDSAPMRAPDPRSRLPPRSYHPGMDRTRWLAAAITILVIVTLVLGPLLEVFASLQL